MIYFRYFSMREENNSFIMSWLRTMNQFWMYPSSHFFSYSLQRKYSSLNRSFSLGNAPFFVTFQKLELIDSIAFVVYMIFHTSTLQDIAPTFYTLHQNLFSLLLGLALHILFFRSYVKISCNLYLVHTWLNYESNERYSTVQLLLGKWILLLLFYHIYILKNYIS